MGAPQSGVVRFRRQRYDLGAPASGTGVRATTRTELLLEDREFLGEPPQLPLLPRSFDVGAQHPDQDHADADDDRQDRRITDPGDATEPVDSRRKHAETSLRVAGDGAVFR